LPPRLPAIEAILMIFPPPPRVTICLATSCEQKKTPLPLTSCIMSHSRSVRSKKGDMVEIPALLTQISILPKRLTISGITFLISARSVTSNFQVSAFAPFFRISSAVFLASSSLMSVTATVAPSAASISAMALPIPIAAPVTAANLPLRRIDTSFLKIDFVMARVKPDAIFQQS